MASRSPRVFSAQFQLLLVTAQLEESEARLEEAIAGGHRLRAWRAARDVDRLWDAVELQRRRLAQPAWRLADPHPRRTGLEPRELLHSRLQGYVHAAPAASSGSRVPAAGTAARAAPGALPRRLRDVFAVGCLGSIAVTAAEIAARGISQRPSLVAAELCALVLAPFAILMGSDR